MNTLAQLRDASLQAVAAQAPRALHVSPADALRDALLSIEIARPSIAWANVDPKEYVAQNRALDDAARAICEAMASG